jgi:plasmid stability protein
LRLPPDLKSRLDKQAESEGRSTGALVRDLLVAALQMCANKAEREADTR